MFWSSDQSFVLQFVEVLVEQIVSERNRPLVPFVPFAALSPPNSRMAAHFDSRNHSDKRKVKSRLTRHTESVPGGPRERRKPWCPAGRLEPRLTHFYTASRRKVIREGLTLRHQKSDPITSAKWADAIEATASASHSIGEAVLAANEIAGAASGCTQLLLLAAVAGRYVGIEPSFGAAPLTIAPLLRP